MGHDFGGYATRANRKCSDGRVITAEAFKHMDGIQVPLVWSHGHSKIDNVLGHAKLEHRADGVYAYGFFNGTPAGVSAKALVEHRDIDSLSIYANRLTEQNLIVHKGDITEVSLVLKGANPGAKIDFVQIAHSDGDIEVLGDEAIITSGDSLEHTSSEKTYKDVFETLDEDLKAIVEFMVSEALKQTV